MTATLKAEIASAAARLIVEEGLEYGPAKRRAARDLRLAGRSIELPDNDTVEDEVRSYIDLFLGDSQPAELAALRAIAADWMERLHAFRPYLSGAVWRGTATRRSAIHIDLYCDDPKSAELALIDMRIDYEVSGGQGRRGDEIDVLNVFCQSAALGGVVRIALAVLDYDDLRGALRADDRGRTPRGNLAALQNVAATT